jgi:hypothetical protein
MCSDGDDDSDSGSDSDSDSEIEIGSGRRSSALIRKVSFEAEGREEWSRALVLFGNNSDALPLAQTPFAHSPENGAADEAGDDAAADHKHCRVHAQFRAECPSLRLKVETYRMEWNGMGAQEGRGQMISFASPPPSPWKDACQRAISQSVSQSVPSWI